MDCILFLIYSTLLCILNLFICHFGPSGFIYIIFCISIVWFKYHHITWFLIFINHHFHLHNHKINIACTILIGHEDVSP